MNPSICDQKAVSSEILDHWRGLPYQYMLMYISRLGWAVDATANQMDIFYVCTLTYLSVAFLFSSSPFDSLLSSIS
jgi:hypothetical protein